MNKQDENKFAMMKALLSFLKINQTIWQESVSFSAAVEELENLIAQIEETRQSIDVDQTGLVSEKKSLKTTVVNSTFRLASQLYAMASKTNNRVLQAKVDFPKSELERQRESELVSTSKNVSDLARTNLPSLTTYQVNELMLDDHDNLISEYENSLPTARLSVTERKANNEKIRTLFDSSKTVLNDQLKRMMLNYEVSSPDFYAGYVNTSKVVDYGIRHEKPEAPAPVD